MSTPIKTRPILMNGAMVRATLSGTKTQTRRVFSSRMVKMMDYAAQAGEVSYFIDQGFMEPNDESYVIDFCPHGKIGERLYVRETFQGPLFPGEKMDDYLRDSTPFENPEFCVYAADGGSAPEFQDADDNLCCRWRPSIHMPRWASRITLEITGVRVERLHDISTEDIIAEGLSTTLRVHDAERDLRDQWRKLWESTGGDWDANPWLWVLQFSRVAP